MTPIQIVNFIENMIGISGKPREIRDAIENTLLENGWTAATAAETTESVYSRVKFEIEKRRINLEEAGNISILHLRGTNDDIVHGSSFVFADDSDTIKRSKINRTFAIDIHNYIKALSFEKFELLGRSVLRELGCVNASVTPRTGDQGIDFYGEFSIGSLVGANPAILNLMHESRVILIGQAKHYPDNPIGPATVRELVGALSLSRTATFSRDEIDLFDGTQLYPFTPVLALLFSTGDFTKGAKFLAKRAGLITFSGMQLAIFLADKGIGLDSRDGQVQFDADMIDSWLF